MEPRHIIPFAHCTVYVWSDDYLETRFPDGVMCPALFDYGPDSAELASKLGYYNKAAYLHAADARQAIRRMHMDHELGHTFLAEREGRNWSPNLRGVAVEAEKPPAHERSAEEHRVLEFQKRLNGTDAEKDEFLKRFGAFRP